MHIIRQFITIETFHTERLLAERLTQNDLDKLFAMHADPMVMITMGGTRTKERTRENMLWNLEQWRENGFGLWMFYRKTDGAWVGRAGLRRVKVGDQEEVELGYALMSAYWNQGYATEIARACLEIAFEILHLKSVVSFTLPHNLPSRRVMEKVGFHYDCDVIISHEGMQLNHVLYRIFTP